MESFLRHGTMELYALVCDAELGLPNNLRSAGPEAARTAHGRLQRHYNLMDAIVHQQIATQLIPMRGIDRSLMLAKMWGKGMNLYPTLLEQFHGPGEDQGTLGRFEIRMGDGELVVAWKVNARDGEMLMWVYHDI